MWKAKLWRQGQEMSVLDLEASVGMERGVVVVVVSTGLGEHGVRDEEFGPGHT